MNPIFEEKANDNRTEPYNHIGTNLGYSTYNPVLFLTKGCINIGSDYIDPVIKEIENLADLPEGWDFGAGNSISKEVINKAKQVYSIAGLLQFQAEVLPHSNGGIVLNFFESSVSDEFLEVTVNPNLTFDYVEEKGKGSTYEILDERENVTLSEIQSKLSKSFSSEWNSSELLILESTPSRNRDLVVTASPIITAGYQYLKGLVLKPKAEQSANTSRHTTNQLYEFQLCTG